MIWVGRLISLAVLLQSIEFFWIRPWRWEIQRREVPQLLQRVLSHYRYLLILRLSSAAAALLFPHPLLMGSMLITTWFLALRWRGTFNGGSDTMTFHILAAWFIASVFPSLERACIFYIAIQLLLSYFVAGVSKLTNSDWRSGQSLQIFLQKAGWPMSSVTCAVLGWGLMGFEILFPLALILPMPFMALAIFFHLANTYVFGLNRFFFAWLAAYPALLMTVSWLRS